MVTMAMGGIVTPASGVVLRTGTTAAHTTNMQHLMDCRTRLEQLLRRQATLLCSSTQIPQIFIRRGFKMSGWRSCRRSRLPRGSRSGRSQSGWPPVLERTSRLGPAHSVGEYRSDGSQQQCNRRGSAIRVSAEQAEVVSGEGDAGDVM